MLVLPVTTLLSPELTQIDRLPARSPLTAFPDATQALTPGAESPWRLNLNGTWQFMLVQHPSQAPQNWDQPGTPEGNWRALQVPGVWTRQGTADLPHYTNWIMPFALNYPEVPDVNPTGLYRRSFDVPRSWQNRRAVLHVGGAESVVLVWCNGRFVGMGKDSRLPSEFDLTDHITLGANSLALMVIRWSDATWIEDQDHWFHGGIHRSVFVEARGAVHLADLSLVADFDSETGDGALSYTARVEGKAQGYSVRARLETAQGQLIVELPPAEVAQYDPTQGPSEQIVASHRFKGPIAEGSAKVKRVAPWSAESPTLYELIVSLIDPTGATVEVHASKVGFKRVEIYDRRLLINGEAVVILGVNRHDHDPDNGKTVSRAEMRAELTLMKQHNINAIRCSHYPNDHALLELASELGLYVLDEANVESHGRYSSVAQDPRAQWPIMERTMRMVMRDKNYACVIGWSLGNEAGHGAAHDAAAAWARHADPSRFVHYECPSFRRFFSGGVRDHDSAAVAEIKAKMLRQPTNQQWAATDVVCPMYPEIWQIEAWAEWAEETELDDRPLILCEFSHAMGNSNGSLSEYVAAFYRHPALGGGFVWDWRDQGLRETDAQGREFWAYGSHFGHAVHDGAFCCNGLVGPDRQPHPALREYAWACRPITVEKLSSKAVRITNRRHYCDSSDLQISWVLQKNGVAQEQGLVQETIAPGAALRFNPTYKTKLDRTHEWHLLFESSLKRATGWAPKQHRVAVDQIALHEPAPKRTQVKLQRTSKSTKISASVTADFGPGQLSLGVDGVEAVSIAGQRLIQGPVTACLWRSPTDNDGRGEAARAQAASKRADWMALGVDRLSQETLAVHLSRNPTHPQLRIEQRLQGSNGLQAEHRSIWTASAAGIRIDEQIKLPQQWDDLARVGIRFEVPADYERLRWFGLGPDESYPDRRDAQTVNTWDQTVSAQYHEYVTPQEHGSHESVRWFELLNAAGGGLRIDTPEQLRFTARHSFDADLDVATTTANLVRREATEVHIDAMMRGLGTDACGPDALPAYRIPAGSYRFTWFLRGSTSVN